MRNSSRINDKLFENEQLLNRNKNYYKLQIRLFTVLSLLFISAAFNLNASAQTTVSPGNLQGWSTADTRPGGDVNLITDATTPAGTGALQMTTGNTTAAKAQFFRYLDTSIPLSGVTDLSYSTKQVSSPSFNGGDPSYQIPVCLNGFDGTDCLPNLAASPTSSFATVVFEPYLNGTVTNNVWQQWDVDQGQFYVTRTIQCSGGTLNASQGNFLYTLPQIQTTCPDAVVLGYGLNIGSNNPNYNVEVDLFNFDGTTFDFEPSAAVSLSPVAAPTATDNDYTVINNAVQFVAQGGTITLSGNFDWTEPNAAASWALGSDGQPGTGDEYTILAPNNLNGVTITAASLGDATIQGPGDLPDLSLEGVFQFFNGTNQNWTISNLRFLDFDNSIGFYFNGGGTNVYDGTQILNNYIRMPQDLNATVAPADDFQNIGLHYSFGNNILISGNTFDVPGDSISDSATGNFATNVVMQSNTSGGAYEGLQITNNTINVLNAPNADPEVIIGIWENGHAHTKNITVSGNQFLNQAAGNSAAANLQRGFRITSQSSANSTIQYVNNRVEGANIGFQWLAGQTDLAGRQPVLLTSNLILNNATGVRVDSNGSANLSFNRIVGNSTAGVENATTGAVTAENNWWGCNYGPGAGGAGCVGTANGTLGTVDADPWLILDTSASPNTLSIGDTSTVTSRLTQNSNGDDTSGLGSVPDTTPATFVGMNGTVSPPNDTTDSGVVMTTFTATTFGMGGVDTTIDGQTVNAPINVNGPCNEVSIPTGTTITTNSQFTVPINVDDTTGRNILSYDFTLNYDPAVVTFISASTAGTLSSGWTITTNNSGGTLVVSGFNTSPLSGAGVLLNLNFIATGGINSTSGLNFAAFQFNEGIPCVNTTNGDVTVISGTVSGTVNYANAQSGTVPVPLTTIDAAGSIPLSTMTDSNGDYSLSGFGPGAYTITPSKSNQVNGISNLDASRVAQHIVGFITLNSTQQIAADVSGNGTITSLDAAYIAQFVAGIPNPSFTGTWRFLPPNRSYPNVQTSYTAQDYSAILLGEVTGNWNPSGPLRPNSSEKTLASDSVAQPEQVVTVSAPPAQGVNNGDDFTVALTASNTTGEGILGYEFVLTYDSSVILPQLSPCDNVGTLSSSLSVTCNPTVPGTLRVVLFGTMPISGAGTLLKLNFNAVGTSGTMSPLTFQSFMFNEGAPLDVTTDGQVLVLAPTAAGVSIEGQVLTADMRGLSDARVTLTNGNGESRTVKTNSFGYYRFDDVPAGQNYTLEAKSRRYNFMPLVLPVADNLAGINIIAVQ